MTTPADRLAILRPAVRDYEGEWTTRMVQHLYVTRFGPGDWRSKARQDLAQLVGEGLLVLDDTDPGRRVYRLNRIHAGVAAEVHHLLDPMDHIFEAIPLAHPELIPDTDWTPRSSS